MPTHFSSGTLRASVALSLLLTLAACQQQQSAPPPVASKPAAAPTPAAAPPATPAVATADSVGIPECDDYLNKYQACVEGKVPEAARGMMRQSLDQTRAAWRTAMASPGGRDGMAAACKQARDAAKTSMAAYGCTDF